MEHYAVQSTNMALSITYSHQYLVWVLIQWFGRQCSLLELIWISVFFRNQIYRSLIARHWKSTNNYMPRTHHGGMNFTTIHTQMLLMFLRWNLSGTFYWLCCGASDNRKRHNQLVWRNRTSQFCESCAAYLVLKKKKPRITNNCFVYWRNRMNMKE